MKNALSNPKRSSEEERKLQEAGMYNMNVRQSHCKKSQLKLM